MQAMVNHLPLSVEIHRTEQTLTLDPIAYTRILLVDQTVLVKTPRQKLSPSTVALLSPKSSLTLSATKNGTRIVLITLEGVFTDEDGCLYDGSLPEIAIFNDIREADNLKSIAYDISRLPGGEAYEKLIVKGYHLSLLGLFMRGTGLKWSDKDAVDDNPTRDIIAFIDAHYMEAITLDDLAKHAHLNKYSLVHVFKKDTGTTPINHLLEKRVQVAKHLLKNTDHSMDRIAMDVGFNSQSYFNQILKKKTGITPSRYRNK